MRHVDVAMPVFLGFPVFLRPFVYFPTVVGIGVEVSKLC